MRAGRATLLATLTALGAACPCAFAGETAIVQEFFRADNAYPQDRHEVQATWRLDRHRDEGEGLTDIALEVEYGITNRFQLQGDLPYQHRNENGSDRVSGWGNVELGFMYAFASGRRLLASAGLTAALPTASAALGDEPGQVVMEPFLILGRRIGRAEVQGDVSAELRSGADRAADLAFVMPVGHWRATLELNAREHAGDRAVDLAPGLVWKPSHGYEMGLAAPFGLGRSGRIGLVLQVTAEYKHHRRSGSPDRWTEPRS